MAKPVRICYLIGSLERCGTSVHLLGFLRRLDRTRFEPWVVGLAEPGPIADAIRALGIEVHAFSMKSIFSLSALRFFFWLTWRIRRTRTTIVQSYLFLENLIGPLSARLGGARIVITGRRTVDDWESPRHRQAYRLTRGLVDHIAVVSPEVAESVYKLEGTPPSRVTIIRNAQSRETLLARADSSEDALLADLDRKFAGGFVFGTVGNVRPIKGHDIFVQAFERVHRRHPGTHLVIVGGIPPGPPEIEKLIASLGLTEVVHLPGLRANIAGFMDRFSVFVLPSRAEGMSNALLEALILGKPVIATSYGLPKGADGLDVVLSVPPGEVDALEEAMERVMTDDALRASLASRGRVYAEATMNEARMVREYEKLYEELLA
jgi:L-malate glycosyltransferase